MPAMNHALANSDPHDSSPAKKLLHAAWVMRKSSRVLFWTGWMLLLVSCVTLLLTQVDARLFQGVSVWLKPWKFQFSTGVYLLTLLLFMLWLPKEVLKARAVQYVVWIAVASGIFEVSYITLQGALGKASHFSAASPFESFMYKLMGAGAVLLVSASLVLAWVIARSKIYALPAALKLSIVLGLIATFFLSVAFGGYMSGQRTGHWVGAAAALATDTGGLPLFAWSRVGGDLRVSHFFAIHAMHFVPLFALVLHRLRVSQAVARPAVWGFTFVFCAFCTWTLVQAMRGQPFWA